MVCTLSSCMPSVDWGCGLWCWVGVGCLGSLQVPCDSHNLDVRMKPVGFGQCGFEGTAVGDYFKDEIAQYMMKSGGPDPTLERFMNYLVSQGIIDPYVFLSR